MSSRFQKRSRRTTIERGGAAQNPPQELGKRLDCRWLNGNEADERDSDEKNGENHGMASSIEIKNVQPCARARLINNFLWPVSWLSFALLAHLPASRQ
jgi:hypothetical protein